MRASTEIASCIHQAAAGLLENRENSNVNDEKERPQGIAGTISVTDCAHISTSSVCPGHPSSIFAPVPLLPSMVTAIGDDAFVGETRSGMRVVTVFKDRLEHEFISLE